VEEKVVHNRPTCGRAAWKGAAWLTSTHVKSSQKLQPEVHVNQMGDELCVGVETRKLAEVTVEGNSLWAENTPRQSQPLPMPRLHPHLMQPNLVSRRWRHPSRDTISFEKSYQLPLRKPESTTVISGEKSVTSHAVAEEHLDSNSQPVILGQLLAASHPLAFLIIDKMCSL